MVENMIRGSKGGGASSFKQTPNNLRSDDTFEGVLGLCIGPIKGPKNGMKSIKVDGTAIENESGEENLKNFVAIFADGDPTKHPQKVALKLGAGAAPTPVNLTIPNTNASSPGPWVTKTLTNTGADFIDLRFIVQQLYKQTKKGIFNNTLTLDIQMKPTGASTWVDLSAAGGGTYSPTGWSLDQGTRGLVKIFMTESMFDFNVEPPPSGFVGNGFTITGKTDAPTVYELRVNVPNEGAYTGVQWDVRVRLREKDTIDNGDDDIQRRTIAWESIAAVYSTVLGGHEDWRGVAWLQVYGKASEQLNGVPEMTGEYDTKIVSVPPSTVYNPTTRQYTGTLWDGSWAKAFTNDPAWVINDAITDSLSGISLLAPGSFLNKWDALEASKWCSELVSDGHGGTHPRYSINIAVVDQMKAEEFVRYLAGAVGGLAWDQGDGEWRLKMDKPEQPLDIFTLENVEGEFLYTHTDIDTRYNDITMAFKNAEMDYREDRVRLFDNPHIARYGRKPTTMVAVGCTNRQEAMRRTKLRLESTTGETRVVNFMTNRRGRNVNQLDMILIADGDLGDREARSTGRTVAVSPDRMSVTLRDYVRLEVGVNYEMNFSSPNPDYDPEAASEPTSDTWRLPTIAQTRGITNSSGQRGNVYTLYLDDPLPVDIPDNLSISLSAPGLPTLPKLYRVLSIVPDDSNPERIGIAALEVNTDKWDNADNVTNEDTVFQDLRGAVPPPTPPPSGDVLTITTVPTELGNSITLLASWTRPPGLFINGFQVRYRFNGGPWQDYGITKQPFAEWPMPAPGIWEVEITTLDRLGGESVALTDTLEVLEPWQYPTALLTNESHTVAAASDGTVASFAGAGGEFQLYNSSGQITTGVTYSVLSESGVDVSINPLTGEYAVVSMSADQGTAVFRAVWEGFTLDKTYSIAKSRAGATGGTGASAKAFMVISDTQTIKYDTTGTLVAGQQVNFLLQRQNTTQPFIVRLYRINSDGSTTQIDAGTYVNGNGTITDNVPDANSFTLTSGTTPFLTGANFNSAIGATGLGVIIDITCDGITDKISIVRVTDGAAGAGGVVGFLTNEVHTLPAANDGTVSSYTGATGDFKIYAGSTDVSSNFTLSTQSNPQSLTIGYSGRTYTVTAGLDPGEENATVTIRATGSGAYAGVTMDKVFTLAKSKTGGAGSAATIIVLTSSAQTFEYTGSGSVQAKTILFTANRQNTSSATEWRVTKPDGTVLYGYQTAASLAATGYFTTTDNDNLSMTHSAFHSLITSQTITGIVIEARISGTTQTDKISVVKVQDGATGATGAPGTSNAAVMLFQRTAANSAPTLPTTTTTYTFATGVATGMNNGWTQTIPPSGGSYLWVTTATASSATATDTIAASEWSTPAPWTDQAIIASLAQIGADSVLHPSEKLIVIREYNELANEHTTLLAEAQRLLLDTSAIAAYKTNLDSGLAALSPAWNDTTQATTGLNRTGWNNMWQQYYDERAKLRRSIGFATAVGTQLSSNPDFRGGSTAGYQVYNNAGGTKVAIATQADSTAPNGSGFRLVIAYDGTGTPDVNPAPSYGGVTQALSLTGAANGESVPTRYAKGTKILLRVIANIPSGRTINTAWNSIGDGGTVEWITPNAGTGAYQQYIALATIGTTGTFSSLGYFYVSGGSNVLFSWYMAKYEQLDITSAVRDFGGTNGGLLNPATGLPYVNGDFRNDEFVLLTDEAGSGGRIRYRLFRGTPGETVITAPDNSWNLALSVTPNGTGGGTITGIGTGNGTEVSNANMRLSSDYSGGYARATILRNAGDTAIQTVNLNEAAQNSRLRASGDTSGTMYLTFLDSGNSPISVDTMSTREWNILPGAGPISLLTAIGSFSTVIANEVKKSGGTHGSFQGGAVGSKQQGATFIRCRVASGSGGWLTAVALDTASATTYDRPQQKFYAQLSADGTGGAGGYSWVIYKDGAPIASGAGSSLTNNSMLEFAHDGIDGLWLRVDGVVKGSPSTIPALRGHGKDLSLFPKIIDYHNTGDSGLSIANIDYGPWPQGAVLRANEAADDNVFSPEEKQAIILPLEAQLDARYTEVQGRAAALGLSTTNATNAKNDLHTFLNILPDIGSASYRDLTQPTVLSNPVLDEYPNISWTVTATQGTDGPYQTLTDSNASDFSYAQKAIAVTPGQGYTVGMRVKRDLTSGRQPAIRMINNGGTFKFADISFNTQLGTYFTSGTPDSAGIVPLNDSEWWVYLTYTAPADVSSVVLVIYPAIGTSGGYANSTTGTFSYKDLIVVNSGSQLRLGRLAWEYYSKNYSYELDLLDKAISQTDGNTSLQLVGPATISIPATASGDASASLPKTQAYTGRNGLVAVSPTWNTAPSILEGSGTVSMSATSGVLTISAIDTPKLRVRITGTYAGVSQSSDIVVERVDATAPTGGGGGSGDTGPVDVFTQITGTTWTLLATVVRTASTTSISLNAAGLECSPQRLGATGSWTVEMKWEREAGATDIQIGTTDNSNPDPAVSSDSEGFNYAESGYITANETDTGRTIGTQYTYYLWGRLSSGTKNVTISGTASATG